MTGVRTLSDRWLISIPASHRVLRQAILVLGGSLLVAAAARVQAPTWPVPITMQTFAVVLVGAALGSRLGALTLIAYLLEGAAGLPVFASPPYSGPAYFAGPTAGYLFGFVAAAWVVGRLAERGWDRRFFPAAAAMAAGDFIILVAGAAWAVGFVGVGPAISQFFIPFVLGGVLKALLAATALPAAWRMMRRMGASPASGHVESPCATGGGDWAE